MIYYLAQAYSNNPGLAIQQAQEWTQALLVKGYTPFSPIMHSHSYDQRFHDGTDYVAWDLQILDAMCHPVHAGGYQTQLTMVFAPTCFSSADELWDHDNMGDRFAYTDANNRESPATEQDYWWVSKGAKKEYEFAKAHHIRCLLLSELLEGREVEI